DLWVVAIVADDQADLESLRTLGDEGLVSRVPRLDGRPWHDLVVLLNDLSSVVHQYLRVVRIPVRVVLVQLSREGEDAPDLVGRAGLCEDVCLGTGDRRRKFLPLFGLKPCVLYSGKMIRSR